VKLSANAKRRGYKPRLTEALIEELSNHVKEGMTVRQASALCGVYAQLVDAWMVKGRAQISANKRSLYTDLVKEIERTQAEYQASLIKSANKAAIDGKRVDGKWIRWRLALASHDFRQSAPTETNGAAFDQVTPDEARTRLEEKLALFIAKHSEASEPGNEVSQETSDH
jgi:hypothetical protein